MTKLFPGQGWGQTLDSRGTQPAAGEPGRLALMWQTDPDPDLFPEPQSLGNGSSHWGSAVACGGPAASLVVTGALRGQVLAQLHFLYSGGREGVSRGPRVPEGSGQEEEQPLGSHAGSLEEERSSGRRLDSPRFGLRPAGALAVRFSLRAVTHAAREVG